MRKSLKTAVCAVTIAAILAGGTAFAAEEEPVSNTEEGSAEEGAVFNIYCYNEEFRTRLADHHPAYITIDESTGRIGNATIRWTMIPTDGNAYQETLMNLLAENESLPADTRVDLFLADESFLGLFADAENEVAVPVKELGITDEELKNQYSYTLSAASGGDGVVRGLTWQCSPGVMIYNRAIAADTWGTDDPAQIQKRFAGWELFMKSAEELWEKGYMVTASASDLFRPYAGNMSESWVSDDGSPVIPGNMEEWVKNAKILVDAGETTTASMWSSNWNAALMPSGGVFCLFGPEWLIRYGLGQDLSGSVAAQGGWAVCRGPESFFWGGTWMFAANGTDNRELAADIMRTMTTDETVMAEIRLTDGDFVNNKTVMDSDQNDDRWKLDVLGGQNPTKILISAAKSVRNVRTGRRDRELKEAVQKAARAYFEGSLKSYEEMAEQYREETAG